MSTATIARRLGLHRSEVRAIEARALAKLAVVVNTWGLGPPIRASLRRQKTCSKCGAPGHQRNTCDRTRRR